MHILLTNDDGIRSEGLNSLLEEAVNRGHEVTVIAPDRQRSGFGHHITTRTPILIRSHKTTSISTRAYGVNGTPVDCVRLAASGELCKADYDIVIAGINNGNNVGTSIYYSGTVAAAREAALCKLRAVAASTGGTASPQGLKATAITVLDMAERYSCIPPLPNCVMNINTPGCDPKEWNPMMYALVNPSHQHPIFEKRESPAGREYFWPIYKPECDGMLSTDQYLINRNHIVISMLGQTGCMTMAEYDQLGI